MENTYEISFIVAVYNVKSYLEECLTSLTQLKKDIYEFIVVDDGSTDGSSEICDKFAMIDKRVKVIHQKNQGVSVARNEGLKVAAGKWICFVDGDDYVLPDNIEKIADSQLDIKNDIIYFPYKQIIGDKLFSPNISEELIKRISTKPFESIQELKYVTLNPDYNSARDFKGIYFFSAPWGKFYNANFLKNNRIVFVKGVIRSQDLLFNMQALKYVEKVCLIPYEGYVYRRNGASITNKYTPDMVEHCIRLIDHYEEIMDDKKDLEDSMLRRTYSEWKVKQLYNLLKSVFCNPNNREKYAERKKNFKTTRNHPYFISAFQYTILTDYKINRRIVVFCIKYNMFWILNLYFRNVRLVQFAQKIMYKIGLE